MMKSIEIFKFCKKNFSIKKYIKPTYNQEYYNSLHSQKFRDKNKSLQNTPGQSVFAMTPPLHPDRTKSVEFHDEQNEHFMYLFYRRQKELQDRATSHIKIAKTAREKKKGKSIYSNVSSTDTNDASIESTKIDEETGLMYGQGYDHLIRRSSRIKTESEGDSYNKLNELVTKLGYLDLRDFVALNKYILEAKNHENLVNQTKAKFLAVAIQRLSDSKKEDLKKNFKRIEENFPDVKTKEEKDNLKIEYMFDNIQGSKDLFYKYYYKLKEINERADNLALDEFEKFEKMIENFNKPDAISHDKDRNYFNKSDDKFYDMNDYMERIIKTYRNERTVQLKTDSHEIINKLKSYMRMKENDKYLSDEVAFDSLIKLAKYETFLNKYKKVYTPTNIETERLINNYLREKRIKEFTKEKMLEEKDAYFSPLTDEENIEDRLSRISDEESKKKAIERHNLKQKYFDAKYEFRLQKLKENIDQELADQLGIVIANDSVKKNIQEMLAYTDINQNQPISNKMQFIDKLLNDHYGSFKLDYMYNYLDFFSNKYKVRRKISEELQRKVSLNEINYILNNLVSQDSAKRDINNTKPIKYDLNQYVKNSFGTVMPTYLEIASKGLSNNPSRDRERIVTAKSAIQKVEKENIELTENDKFEVELYKGIKNDPYYKHYLFTNLSYFSETMNDTVSGLPHFLKGFKLKDYIKYERLTDNFKKSSGQIQPLNNQELTDRKSEIIESMNNPIFTTNKIQAESKTNKNLSVYGRGKRKKAKASAEIKPGNGTITVNGLEFHRYFSHPIIRGKILMPLELTDTICLYDIKLTIQGGGSTGQADAAIPAISKALIKINPEWRPILAKNLCLKHDPRNVEPKKPGRIKARKEYVYNRR